MKNPTAEELAVLRERAERTFSRFPVLPRREDGRMSPKSRLRFELTLETILEKNRALGACVVLRRPSGAHETFCFGTARLLGRVPVTEETCFRVASVSKLVMTFGALALVERGVLGLDDALSACLGYPVRNPRFPDVPVTLRMLLTHTASIRDEGNYGSRGMQKGCTLRELLENADNWLPARPGEAFHYTNLGAGAAGAGLFSAFRGASGSNGFRTTLGAAISSLIGGNGIKGTTGLLSAAAGTPGLLSGYQSAGSVLRGAIGNSKTAQWLGGIGSSLGNLGGLFANSKAGQFAGGLMGKAGGALGKLTMPLRQGIAGIGAAATIQGSIFQQGLSGLLGKAGGVVSGIANSGAGKAVGSIFSGGAGLLGSIYGPIAGGLGGLLSGALPIVGVISSIIAVVSILTDKFGGLDKIVQRVFGDTGLEKFTVFKNALLGLFEDGGVAKALQPLQESITNLFGEDAGAAFGGITTILQSVMGVIGQLVTFSQTTVRPIIESIFSFITQTVVPVILQTITAAAPSIASIISGVGSVVMTVAQIIGEAIQFLMPIIQTVITVLLHIGQVVVPAVLAAIGVFAEGISSAINGVKTIFEGVINFITGVFSGNWRMAWEGVKSIFVGIFDTLGALFKTPINAVIALINKAIAGINSLGITIPDWVPLLGGKSFSINIPEIPMLARGGFTNGASIAGEAGTEAVISFQRAARRDNLDIWAKAGQMLGVKPVELADIDGGGSGGGGGMTFAPVINIQGSADRSMVEEALAEAQARFEAWYLQMQRRQARTAY